MGWLLLNYWLGYVLLKFNFTERGEKISLICGWNDETVSSRFKNFANVRTPSLSHTTRVILGWMFCVG
jgi:hypothetical protein